MDRRNTDKRNRAAMNSLEDIWQAVLEALSRSLTQTAMTTWFNDCKPVEIVNNRFVLCATTDFKRNIIRDRYGDLLRAALVDIFSSDFELTVLTPDELPDYKQEREAENGLPEMAGYTFDHFVVGPSNQFAYAAAKAVSEQPGKVYNPLFIYGNSGLGKTHLLLSIGQAIHHERPTLSLAYIKGDSFINDMVKAIKTGEMEDFRTRYRNVNLFLVDDIQFIAGKDSTQEEFFHTFNSIYEAGHQIVITSDRPPMDMPLLDDRLRTRFEGGLMADIQPPNLETRIAIITNKATQLGMVLSDEVTNYIAESLTSNIRQIEGVVKRLTAYKDLMNDEITIASVKRAIKDVIRVGNYIPTPDAIIGETARYFGFSAEDLTGTNQTKDITKSRQVAMYLIRSLTNLSLPDIGNLFNRNHSTVLTSIRKVEKLLNTEADMPATIRNITSNINSRM